MNYYLIKKEESRLKRRELATIIGFVLIFLAIGFLGNLERKSFDQAVQASQIK